MAVWPLARRVFRVFPDQGWGLSKILGLLLTSWIVWILGSTRIAPFRLTTVIGTLIIIFVFLWIILPLINWRLGSGRIEGREQKRKDRPLLFSVFRLQSSKTSNLRLVLFEELLFLTAFGFWSYVRAFNPDIRGLEKFMDYGFMLSILRTKYFPPLDHFLAGETINYYYFGHLVAAILTRLSGVIPPITFNLQIALLFGLAVLGSFSVGAGLYGCSSDNVARLGQPESAAGKGVYLAGFLTALFVAVIGNLHAVSNIRNLNTYWYPTASRLIPNTINEFPSYSFVVADLHGHVSDIPIVLLIIGLLFVYVFTNLEDPDHKTQNGKQRTDARKQMTEGRMTPFSDLGFQKSVFNFPISAFRVFLILALALGATFATNSWDYPFFLILAGLLFLLVEWKRSNLPFAVGSLRDLILPVAGKFVLVFLLSVVLFLPYWLTVHPNVDGVGLVAFVGSFNPKDLQEIKNLPLPLYLFKRFIIRSPLNLLFILWGFYGFLAVVFGVWVMRRSKESRGGEGQSEQEGLRQATLKALGSLLGLQVEVKSVGPGKTLPQLSTFNSPPSDLVALLMMILAFLLIVLPEWIYINDIYKPDYYRANTLFKFYYAAWIMLGVATAYGLIRILSWIRTVRKNFLHFVFLAVCFLLIASVLLYPVIAINSTTGRFGVYKGLNGVSSWMLGGEFNSDYQAIAWLNRNVSGQPTVVEAVGDSYTDAARVSAMTGLPTVLGWPVHEWLWRGSYSDAIRPVSKVQQKTGQTDSVAARLAEIKQFYETTELELAKDFLVKYGVDYIYLGKMEYEKYPNLDADKFGRLGEIVYQNENVRIYRVKG